MSAFENLRGAKYMSLVSYRQNGAPIATPVWFAEDGDKLYVVTRAASIKVKRISRNPRVEVAPCTIRGKVTGPAVAGSARVLPKEDWPAARKLIGKKYFLSRLSLTPHKNVYIEVVPA